MLTVGKNTYVTIDEATEYINSHYSQKNILRAHWTVAPDEFREQYLLQSVAEIEALPFIGRKYNYVNELQFPRIYANVPYNISRHPIYRIQYGEEGKVPEQVKFAQIENALGIIKKSYRPDKAALIVLKLGVVPEYKEVMGDLSSERALRLLTPFLGSLRA
ncbi:MAG: DnaT-like ssDNA-binding protein [Candidatus Coproplasma sp.]